MTYTAYNPDRSPRPAVSRQEWLKARTALLEEEKELTRQRDRVAAQRRALPWVKVAQDYVFDAPDGQLTLADLFDGRSQLAIYHFMLTPGSNHICPGCSFIADHVDAARRHFEQADLSFAAVSRAPLPQIEAVKQRMGWQFRWASSHGSSFNYDFGVSFTDRQIADGTARYNYAPMTWKNCPDLHGTSIFAKNAAGEVFHTYSTFSRGDEVLLGAFSFLDLTPNGRNEDSSMSWLRLHDEYEKKPAAACCHT
jgi:predicted dithiol-disulfide oxidoreductase (DUF899 family)